MKYVTGIGCVWDDGRVTPEAVIPLHFDPNLNPPPEVVAKAVDLDRWMEMNDCVQLMGLGRVHDLQRQLAEVTKERDQLRAMLGLADALRNRERQKDVEGRWPFPTGFGRTK